MADSKFAQLLAQKKIDPRRLLAVSHKLETLQREDRGIRLAKRRAKAGAAEGGGDAKEKDTRKPRSGRPITQRAIDAALAGKAGQLSGPVKTRLLRALNHILEQKKQDKVDLKALF